MSTAVDAIGSDAPINYAVLSPIPLPKTITLVNNFVLNTTRFLNRFSNECDLKLADVSHRITNTQTLLCVLECKLRSIPGLEDGPPPSAEGVAPATADGSPTATTEPPPAAPQSAELPSVNADTPAAAAVESTALVPASSALVNSNMRKASEHPRYRKFFKMLSMHIPLPACQQKMSVELPDDDLSLLERPDEMVEMSPEDMEDE